MKNANETIAEMITNNLLDESLTTSQVESVLTDAYNDAVANGEEPAYNVSELVEYWNKNYAKDEKSLDGIFNDYKNGEIELSQLEELAMLDEYGEDNDRTEYANKFNEWANLGLENWFVQLSDEELANYEVTDEDINSIINEDNGTIAETFELRKEQAKKLLEKALQNEKSNRN